MGLILTFIVGTVTDEQNWQEKLHRPKDPVAILCIIYEGVFIGHIWSSKETSLLWVSKFKLCL